MSCGGYNGCKVSGTLVLLGALNWGLVGALDFNLVTAICGAGTLLTKIVYIVIGLAAILAVVSCCKNCSKGDG